jgi:hypothetical protein
MKNLYLSLIICILAGLILPSCRSSVSVKKRHYTSGFYFARNSSRQAATGLHEQKKPGAPSAKPKEKNEHASLGVNPITYGKDLVASAEHNTKGRSKPPVIKRKPFELTFAPQKTHHVRLIQKKKTPVSSEQEGLSLFWVVILVLLILWALGIIGGFTLGGLIYILLVVALILLILWLLRIL